MLDDDDFIQDGKYRGYVTAIDKALKNFESSSEWADLISALGKLSKVISSNSKYKLIPRRLLLSKRLSQCLHPSLPSGVHLKAIETYDLIFKCIGGEKLAAELFIYSAGLFPLLSYAGISVRPSLLSIYETHLLPLGEKLGPCLDGFLPAILLGMEETSDFYQRTTTLLDSVKLTVGVEKFYTTLWKSVHLVPQSRQPAVNYMLGNKENIVGEDLEQVITSIQHCLVDSNILVQRASLELLAARDLGKCLVLVKAALKTLLRRDSSLNRRLFTWLAESEEELVEAIQCLLCDGDEDNFRILIYLFDKNEICEKILDRVLIDVIRSLYIHNAGIIRSANLFFATLHPNYIWEYFYKELCGSLDSNWTSRVQKPGSGKGSLPEFTILLSFLIDLDSTLDKSFLPQLSLKLLELVSDNLIVLSWDNLQSFLCLISSFETTQETFALFQQIYVKFVCRLLVKFPIDLDFYFEKLQKKEFNIYENFECGLFKSIGIMAEKRELCIPSIDINVEAFECFKILNAILASYNWDKGNFVDDMLNPMKCLLIISSMAESDQVRSSAIDNTVGLLEVISASGILNGTICIQSMANYLWSRMPYCKANILQLYKSFPLQVERVLTTRVVDSEYVHVIELLHHNMKLDNNFDSLVLKCLDNLDSIDAVAKSYSENFAYEFLSCVGVLVDPLLKIFEENLAVLESVLTFEEKEKQSRKKSLSYETFSVKANVNSNRESIVEVKAYEQYENEPRETENVVDCSIRHISRKPELFVDLCGRIVTKPENVEDEFDDIDVRGLMVEDSYAPRANLFGARNTDEELQIIESDNEEIFGVMKDELSDSLIEENAPDTISGNVFEDKTGRRFEEDYETDVEAEVNLVLQKLDLDLEESLGGEMLENLEGEALIESCKVEDGRDMTLKLTVPDTMEHTEYDIDQDDLTTSLSLSQVHTPDPSLIEQSSALATKHRLFSIHPYNTQLLIYTKNADHPRVMYALGLLKNVINISSRAYLISMSTTVSSSRRMTYLEILLSYLLKLSQGFYSDEGKSINVSIHVEAIRLIGNILTGLLELISSKGFGNFIGDMFSKIKLQKTILYTLASLVMMKSDEELTSTERILKVNYEKDFDIVYNEILKVTTSIIAVEVDTFQHQKVQVPPSNKYIPNVQFCRQPLYLESLLKTLTNSSLYSCHQPTLNSIANTLPFYESETAKIVSKVVECICGTLKSCRQDNAYLGRVLECLTSITHYVLLEQSNVEKVQQQSSTHILYSLVSAFLPVGGSSNKLREKDATSPTNQQKSIVPPAKAELLGLLPHLISALLTIWDPALKMKILDLINPIAFNHVSSFIHAIGKQPDQIPVCVEMVGAMKVIILENLVSGIITCAKTADDETHQLTLLNFLSSYLDKCKNLSEIWHLIISLIKEAPNLPGRSQLTIFEICYKLAASGVPIIKTDLKELQETSYKLIEIVSSHSSTEKKYKNDAGLQLEVLQCLSTYLVPLVDLIWGSEEKVLPLVVSVVYYVMPHLKFRYPQPHYSKTLSFIANLSVCSYLRKSWKKDIFEIVLDQNFFTFNKDCLPAWKTTLDNLFTQDKYTFNELLGRVSVPQTGSLNIFSSKEIEYESRAMLLKRLAFVIFCSRKDQYVKFITNIQERLAEAIKMPQTVPTIQAQVFLCFRVLLLRLSPQHLGALWPIILHEILLVLIQMETDILTKNPNWLHLYLELCKLLELTLNLPSSQLPVFQMYRWTFTGPSKASHFTPHLTRLAELLEETKSTNGVQALRSNKIESLGELYDFLKNCNDRTVDISVFENVLENDFLE